MRIGILTQGSQGDVRPFLALGLALQTKGHDVFIATNESNKKFFAQKSLKFVPLPGNLEDCLNAGTEHSGIGKVQIVRNMIQLVHESARKQFESLQNLLKNVDAVVYHPVVFTAEHVIEALKIPSIKVYTTPDIPTRYYACCIFPPRMPLQQWANRASHFIGAQLFWAPFRKIINETRTKDLGLKKLGFFAPLSHQPFQAVPKVIAASKALVPPAPDWPKNVHVAGFMELRDEAGWVPPTSLQQFINAGAPPVYIGFGSLTKKCDEKMSAAILNTLHKLPIRTILCGPFLHIKKDQLPSHVLWIESAPHDWLFPRVAAIVHHGGAGTTHASLLAGKPTLVVPFICDQFHWGDRVHQHGAGPVSLPSTSFTHETFQKSLEQLLKTPSYQIQANRLSQEIQRENGVERVIELLHQYCENYADSRDLTDQTH